MIEREQRSASVHSSSMLAQSIEAFYRALPELLNEHYGKWVAFHGDKRVGIARTETELYQQCVRSGLKEDEFIVLFADEAACWDREEIDLPLNP